MFYLGSVGDGAIRIADGDSPGIIINLIIIMDYLTNLHTHMILSDQSLRQHPHCYLN